MRSRFTPQTLLWRARTCHTLSGLAAGGIRYSARRVGQVELSRAVVTKPDQDVWSVRPEERTHSSSHLHCVVNAES